MCDAEEVLGPCEVVCGEDVDGDLDEWFLGGADRFCFYQEYDKSTKQFNDPPAESRGRVAKGKGKVCTSK